jgi:hypothetical protein
MIAVLVIAAAGWAYRRRLDEGVLVGGVLAALALLILDLIRVPWSAVSFLIALAVLCSGVRFGRRAPEAGAPTQRSRGAIALHACTAGVVVWHYVYAVRPDLWDWSDWLISRRDFFFIWGYKARLFFTEHGIPWSFLRTLPNDFAHPDYPLLVPLMFDIQPVLTGIWQPSTIAAIDTALAVALLAIVYRALRDDFDPLFAAAATLALSGSALLPWVGLAEGPLVAYGGTAALLIRRALRGRAESLPLAILALGGATMAKNEGIALAVSMAIALGMTAEGRAVVAKLWPVAVVIATWLIARTTLHLTTDLFSGPILARVAHNVGAFPKAFANVPTYQPIVWMVSLLAVALAPSVHARRERFLLITTVVQVFFYLAAYAITPLDVAGHVNGSWPRLTSHVTIFVAFAGATSIGTMLKR